MVVRTETKKGWLLKKVNSKGKLVDTDKYPRQFATTHELAKNLLYIYKNVKKKNPTGRGYAEDIKFMYSFICENSFMADKNHRYEWEYKTLEFHYHETKEEKKEKHAERSARAKKMNIERKLPAGKCSIKRK